MDWDRLKRPFLPNEIEWRVGQAGKNKGGNIWCKVLAYLTNRAIQSRLDEVCGPENWRNEYVVGPQGGVMCGISIRCGEEWVTKWDGAENTDIEAVKGGLSDAMKRAAVQWGIGRYLYDLDEGWAEISSERKPGSHYANCKIKVDGKEEWVQFNWLPPQLPDWALPAFKSPSIPAQSPRPADTAKPAAAKPAARKPLDTRDPQEIVDSAKSAIAEAVTKRDEHKLTAIAGGISQYPQLSEPQFNELKRLIEQGKLKVASELQHA